MQGETRTSSKGAARSILPTPLWMAICTAFVVIAYLQISDGRVYVDIFPADTAFVIDAVLRIQTGQVPHVDFTLHLGSLPYALTAIVGADTPARGFLTAQAGFSTVCLMIATWVWHTRLERFSGAFLLLFVLLMSMSNTVPAQSDVTLALFYNRWGWVMVILFACQVLLQSRSRWRGLDGAITGLLAITLFTTKITFFVGLLAVAFAVAVLRRQWRELGGGLLVFSIVVLVVFWMHPGFWPGYVENMRWAATNPLRPNAGTALILLIGSPIVLGYTVSLLLFVVVVWRAHGVKQAMFILLAAAGFYFIQYQNYGNAPFWVAFFAVYALVHIPGSIGVLRRGWGFLSVIFVVFSVLLLAPMVPGLIPSAKQHGFVSFPPDGPVKTGIYVTERAYRPIVFDMVDASAEPAPFAGETECVMRSGWIGNHLDLAAIVADLPGDTFVTDSISPHWYLAGKPPLRGYALWNYGSVRGIENADFVLVPKCAQKPLYKREILREIERRGISITQFRETESGTVYRLTGSTN